MTVQRLQETRQVRLPKAKVNANVSIFRKTATVSKNKRPFENLGLFFNFKAQSRFFVWLCNFDPGLFLIFESKTQMGFYFLRL